MGATDKTATVSGKLQLTPQGATNQAMRSPFLFTTGTFTQFHSGAYTLAASGSKTITIADYNLSGDPEIFKIGIRDIVTLAPKCGLVTLTCTAGTQAGLTTVASNKFFASDLIIGNYDLQDLVSFTVEAQNSGNNIEVTWAFGGT